VSRYTANVKPPKKLALALLEVSFWRNKPCKPPAHSDNAAIRTASYMCNSWMLSYTRRIEAQPCTKMGNEPTSQACHADNILPPYLLPQVSCHQRSHQLASPLRSPRVTGRPPLRWYSCRSCCTLADCAANSSDASCS